MYCKLIKLNMEGSLMKKRDINAVLIFMFTMILIIPISISSQGTLLPGGPPAKTMKSLDEIYKAAESRTPISGSIPFAINSSGSYYLTGNITVKTNEDAIIIQAGNVTIDLNGFTITGPGNKVIGSSNGIYCSGYYNITIINGNILEFGKSGISCATTTNTLVMNIKASNNGENGISVGAYAIIKNCQTAYNGATGINAGTASVIENCSSNCNTANGYYLAGSTTVKSSVAYTNTGTGFYSSGQIKYVDCISSYNTGYGFKSDGAVMQSRASLELINSTSQYNTLDGVYCGSRSYIENCSINENTLKGINMAEGVIYGLGGGVDTKSIVKNCNITGNDSDGIYIFSQCDILENNISSNGRYGIYVTNFSIKPAGTDYGTHNRIQGNYLTDNVTKGIYIPGKGINIIIKNIAISNGAESPWDDYDIETTYNKIGIITEDMLTHYSIANIY